MISLVSIYTGAVLTIMVAIFHTQFYKLFKWKKEYESISEINRKIFHTIHLALLILFFGIGIVSIVYAKELSECNGIAFGINIMISVFWIWRTIWQLYYFKGKTMHYVLIVIFFLLFIAFTVPVVLNLQ